MTQSWSQESWAGRSMHAPRWFLAVDRESGIPAPSRSMPQATVSASFAIAETRAM